MNSFVESQIMCHLSEWYQRESLPSTHIHFSKSTNVCSEMIYRKCNYCNQKHRKNYYGIFNNCQLEKGRLHRVRMTSNWGEEKGDSCLLDVGRSTLVRETEQRAWRCVCLYFRKCANSMRFSQY